MIAEFTFRNARVGDVLLAPQEQQIPDGWHELDGGTLPCFRWPDYARAMGLRGGLFTLPESSSSDGYRYLVKLRS